MMHRVLMLTLGVWIAVCAATALGDSCHGQAISPTSAASMSVTVAAHEMTTADGATLQIAAATLALDPPEIRDWAGKGKVGKDFDNWFKAWEPWPGQAKATRVGPSRDAGAPILGGLYRSVLADSVVVTSADGATTYVAGKDYTFNADWGQVAPLAGRLGAEKTEIAIRCRFATQRIDLIQADASGAATVKKGKPAVVCPMLPAPDAGSVAVAGVYIAPWRVDGAYVIAADSILPIKPAAPVAPINPGAVAATLAKLRAGDTVKIAIMGDSITVGAEAGPWWDKAIMFTERDLAYRGRVIYGLRTRFPEATVTPIEASRGGSDTRKGVEALDRVLPREPDLMLIAFGVNDATSGVGGNPRLTLAGFKKAILAMVAKAKAAGVEVILVTPMQPSPFLKNEHAKRIPGYRQALIEAGRESGVGVADVQTEWMNMATRGIPPYTQLHNWNNHPGAYGHKVYADVILRFFD